MKRFPKLRALTWETRKLSPAPYLQASPADMRLACGEEERLGAEGANLARDAASVIRGIGGPDLGLLRLSLDPARRTCQHILDGANFMRILIG